MRRRRHVVITGAGLVVALCAASGAEAASAACTPVAAGTPRTLLERVPALISSPMTPTADGGAVIAFASYRGSREFSHARFTVLGLDPAGCTRWRVSLPGEWPLTRPLQADAKTIVAGASTRRGLGIYTLSASTGRVLHKDVLASLSPTSGNAPTMVADARGNVAALLATRQSAGTGGRSEAVTVKLTRPAHATRWTQTVIARSNTSDPAAAALPDGRMVVGYPRRGRFWVRLGTVAGSLGAPRDAGPITANFRGADVSLGKDGTVAAVWESTTYSRPWRLRAAVLPARARRFAPSVLIGAFPGRSGTLLNPATAAVHVGAAGQVTIGFAVASLQDADPLMCVTGTRAGRFSAPVQVAATAPGFGAELPAMVFGRTGTATSVLAAVPPDDSQILYALLTLDSGCRVHGSASIAAASGPVAATMIDARGRTWILGQEHPSVDSRRPLLLTIAR
ncbi:MAG: hypothetical protein QOK16_1566 [Solirubrobacteraceae bacterium]|jgi:hypothetical protein|nr:hypothetical protein [Solirubrobacteraceae bacterium]